MSHFFFTVWSYLTTCHFLLLCRLFAILWYGSKTPAPFIPIESCCLACFSRCREIAYLQVRGFTRWHCWELYPGTILGVSETEVIIKSSITEGELERNHQTIHHKYNIVNHNILGSVYVCLWNACGIYGTVSSHKLRTASIVALFSFTTVFTTNNSQPPKPWGQIDLPCAGRPGDRQRRHSWTMCMEKWYNVDVECNWICPFCVYLYTSMYIIHSWFMMRLSTPSSLDWKNQKAKWQGRNAHLVLQTNEFCWTLWHHFLETCSSYPVS